MKIFLTLLTLLILTAGCTDDDAEARQEHVWKEQTDAMNKAQAVEGILQDSADASRNQIQDQAQ